MFQVTTPASGVILIQGSNQSTKVLAPVNTRDVRVASSADTLWEADGDGYIRPKGQALVKAENVEIDISGDAGEDGVSVPAGGTTDQVLAKASAADHDFKWIYMNGVKNRIYVPKGTPTVYDDEFDDGVISEDWIDVFVPGYQEEFYEPEGLKGLSMLSPYGKGSYKLTGKLKSIGGLTYPCYIETAIKQVAKSFNFPGLCLVFSDGTTMGSGVQVGLSVLMSYYYLSSFRFTGFNTRTNFSDMSRHSGSNYDWLHLRVVWESENTFSTYISADGVTWAKVHSGLNYACTPTYAGVMEVNLEGSSEDVVGTFGYFRARSGLPSNG